MRGPRVAMLGVLALVVTGAPVVARQGGDAVVGSKKFTESVILGEIAATALRAAGVSVRHRRELGGTRVLWQALRRGDIDVYPEYTGTLRFEILARQALPSDAALASELARLGLAMTAPLGFDNSYALGMRAKRAAALEISRISDLRAHPELALGFGNEFLNRADGWPGLARAYGLTRRNVRGLDHDLGYRGLAAGDLDVLDVYTTDAEIVHYGLRVLEDDRGYFPRYRAVYLYRADLGRRAPAALAALERLSGRIDETAMRTMNAAVKLGGNSEAEVATRFLDDGTGRTRAAPAPGLWRRLLTRTVEHLELVGLSLGAAIAMAVPLGIFAYRRPRPGQAVLAVAGIIQTIPALALLVFMIPLLGIGGPPAVVALFLYSLLPILRNTHVGLTGISPAIRESATALGLPPGARLRRIELPLAGRSIMAGVKTAAVINIGTATLGALIGAGGYGQPILTGIRLDDIGLILEGAVPAAALALAVQGLFEAAERLVVPRGLRIKATE